MWNPPKYLVVETAVLPEVFSKVIYAKYLGGFHILIDHPFLCSEYGHGAASHIASLSSLTISINFPL